MILNFIHIITTLNSKYKQYKYASKYLLQINTTTQPRRNHKEVSESRPIYRMHNLLSNSLWIRKGKRFIVHATKSYRATS